MIQIIYASNYTINITYFNAWYSDAYIKNYTIDEN